MQITALDIEADLRELQQNREKLIEALHMTNGAIEADRMWLQKLLQEDAAPAPQSEPVAPATVPEPVPEKGQ